MRDQDYSITFRTAAVGEVTLSGDKVLKIYDTKAHDPYASPLLNGIRRLCIECIDGTTFYTSGFTRKKIKHTPRRYNWRHCAAKRKQP